MTTHLDLALDVDVDAVTVVALVEQGLPAGHVRLVHRLDQSSDVVVGKAGEERRLSDDRIECSIHLLLPPRRR